MAHPHGGKEWGVYAALASQNTLKQGVKQAEKMFSLQCNKV